MAPTPSGSPGNDPGSPRNGKGYSCSGAGSGLTLVQPWHLEQREFTTIPGSILDRAWQSREHSLYLDQFFKDDENLDIILISIPNWTTACNIPCRTVRLQRLADPGVPGGWKRLLFSNDLLVGKWWPCERPWLKFYYNTTNKTRVYENAPGSTLWVRRAESWAEEGNWATYLAPLVVQFPGVMQPPLEDPDASQSLEAPWRRDTWQTEALEEEPRQEPRQEPGQEPAEP